MFLSAPDSIILKFGKLCAQPCSEFSHVLGGKNFRKHRQGQIFFVLTVLYKGLNSLMLLQKSRNDTGFV